MFFIGHIDGTPVFTLAATDAFIRIHIAGPLGQRGDDTIPIAIDGIYIAISENRYIVMVGG